MNRRSFIRKVFYLVCIGLLLIPLSCYSQPATIGANDQPVGGGKLAKLREENGISEASLGEVDPKGESIKLATLGLRGVAVVMLWEKAKNAQMKEDWGGLQATLDQLTKLEPHFLTFWRHQAWNVSYNISVEWDDYHDRYRWVKEGIKLLMQGFRYNDREPLLVTDIGWTTGQKMGTADEKVQYRRLFREDDDAEFPAHQGRNDPPFIHQSRPQSQRDNWLVAQWYNNRAISLVDELGASIHRQNPLLFFSWPAMCQINYAINLEEDGIFQERAREGWSDANEYWDRFGSRPLVSTFEIEYRLNDQEEQQRKAAELVARLEELAPGLREKMREELKAKLPAEEREIIDTPRDQLAIEDLGKTFSIGMKLFVSHEELGQRVEGPRHDEAVEIGRQATQAERLAQLIDQERGVVNFKYWRLRCRAEKTEHALETRRLLYDAKKLYEEARTEEARDTYEQAFAEWRHVVDEFPDLVDDAIGGTSMEEAVKGYVDVLKQNDEPFPMDFPIKNVVRSMMFRNALPIPREFVEEALREEPADQPTETPDPARREGNSRQPGADPER